MKNQTLWIIGGAVIVYYLYTKSAAAKLAAQQAQAQQNQTNDYINEGVDLAGELF
jgi:hypothetical protein